MRSHSNNRYSPFTISLFFLLLHSTFLTMSCESKKSHDEGTLNETLSAFDAIPKSKVMIVGTHHFNQEDHYDELSDENQVHIQSIINKLAEFKPTKVVIEKEVQNDSLFNALYLQYRSNPLFIDSLPNEAFQLGFRLAHIMNHDRIYLFDDQTEFIGSLENFTFDNFGTYADNNDSGFYDIYKDIIVESYATIQDSLSQLDLYQNVVVRNSPVMTHWNAQRMHAYEIRVGIQKSWIGPDWLARYYQRNIRMMANIMSYNDRGQDRIVVIVGDNHKWVLDLLFDNNPEFEVESSYEFLK